MQTCAYIYRTKNQKGSDQKHHASLSHVKHGKIVKKIELQINDRWCLLEKPGYRDTNKLGEKYAMKYWRFGHFHSWAQIEFSSKAGVDGDACRRSSWPLPYLALVAVELRRSPRNCKFRFWTRKICKARPLRCNQFLIQIAEEMVWGFLNLHFHSVAS
jgi:hypothetical protein